jgi:hypothetical protein
MEYYSIRIGVLTGAAIFFVSILSSCASIQPTNSINTLNAAGMHDCQQEYDQAIALFQAGEYQRAEDGFKHLAKLEFSQSRMEELQSWLGRCELCLSSPFKPGRFWAVASDGLSSLE